MKRWVDTTIYFLLALGLILLGCAFILDHTSTSTSNHATTIQWSADNPGWIEIMRDNQVLAEYQASHGDIYDQLAECLDTNTSTSTSTIKY